METIEVPAGNCLRCSQPLRLSERILEEDAIPVPGRGELCPSCYHNLDSKEYECYFP